MIRAAQTAPAEFSVIPIQDVLGLGSESRWNTPSTPVGNYRWRMQPGVLKPEIARKLATLAEVTDRVPPEMPRPAADECFA
jgi:4-alpha-glucanotransferase